MIIENGVGNGNTLFVDANNQAHVFAESETVIQDAVNKGNAYNINTGFISLTSTGSQDNAVLYIKNNESPVNGESAISLDTLIIGINNGGVHSQTPELNIIRNPTAGTIVSGASVADIKLNRNFGSSNELDSIIYKGADGNTFTDGTDYVKAFLSTNARNVLPIDTLLEKGSSIGIEINAYLSSGTAKVYVAVIGHRLDGKNKNS